MARANKEKDRAHRAEYYQKHREEFRAKAMVRNRLPENKAKRKAYQKAHPEQNWKGIKTYRENHPIRNWAYQSISGHRRSGYIVKIEPVELAAIARNNPNCYYCGIPMDFSLGNKGKVCANSPTVDRRDNGMEMSAENINIVCYSCNATKRHRTYSEFIEYCKKIATRWGE